MHSQSCVAVVGCVALIAGSVRSQCQTFGAEFGLPGVAHRELGSNTILGEHVLAVALFDSGSGAKLYAGGNFSLAGEVAASWIAAWNGTQWEAVGARDALNGDVLALSVFDDGHGPALFAAGMFTAASGQSSRFVAKWNGSSWIPMPGLSGPATQGVSDMAVFDDGSGDALYVGGRITQASGSSCGGVAKWTGGGWVAVHPSFPGGTVSELETYDLGTGPRLFIGGSASASFQGVAHNICSWDGTSFQPLSSGLDSYVTALHGFDDGSGPALYVGGYFGSAGGVAAPKVARWNGLNWAPVGALAPDQPFAFADFDDGNGARLIAGCMPYGPAPYDETLMQWDGANWQVYRGATSGSGAVFALQVGDDGSGHGDELYIGGKFVRAGATRALHVARLRELQWEALGAGGGKAQRVDALAVHDDGTGPAIYAGSGDRSDVFPETGTDRVERWDGSTWTALGETSDGVVNVLGSFTVGGVRELYAGGDFDFIDGVSARNVARWDGHAWHALGTGSSPGVSGGEVHAMALHDDGSGPRLFVAGTLSTAGGIPVASIATWDGTSWADVGGGTNGTVYAMATADFGGGSELYIGGGFSTAGSVTSFGLARWDGANWHDVGGSMAGGLNQGVFALGVFDDGAGPKLYAGGKFSMAGGVAAQRIAVWDGTNWSPMGSGANLAVFTFAVHDDGFGPQLYAGGSFTSIGGVAANRLARWNGSQWSAQGELTDGPVQRIVSFNPKPGRSELWLAGGFVHASGLTSSKVAHLSEIGACAPTSYCTPKLNSQGCLPVIFATGTASAGASNFRVKAADVLNNKSGMLFWGFGAKSAPFQGGYLCVAPPTLRTSVQHSGGNPAPDDCSGSYSFHWSSTYLSAHALDAGRRVFCQYWMRDPASASSTGLSAGLSFLVEP